MEKYIVAQTVNTPKVELDPQGRIEIEGVSISEDSTTFFTPILEWIDLYSENPHDTTNIEMSVEYMDSGSFGYFNLILERFNRLHVSGKSKVSVKWSFEEDDLDMEEYGHDLKRMYDFSVELVPIDAIT